MTTITKTTEKSATHTNNNTKKVQQNWRLKWHSICENVSSPFQWFRYSTLKLTIQTKNECCQHSQQLSNRHWLHCGAPLFRLNGTEHDIPHSTFEWMAMGILIYFMCSSIPCWSITLQSTAITIELIAEWKWKKRNINKKRLCADNLQHLGKMCFLCVCVCVISLHLSQVVHLSSFCRRLLLLLL